MKTSEVYVPDSYIQNQTRMQGNSTNLMEANTIEYLSSRKLDRIDRNPLLTSILNKVDELLASIKKVYKNPQHKDISEFKSIVDNLPTDDLREIWEELTLPKVSDYTKLSFIKSFEVKPILNRRSPKTTNKVIELNALKGKLSNLYAALKQTHRTSTNHSSLSKSIQSTQNRIIDLTYDTKHSIEELSFIE